ncbi:MAG: hypothetical protein LBQ02_00135 [Candidatus Nomurabacteria bacterium]|nr:hypothetical protein [Candidatus Nomurabacteria bacterium]
MNTKQKLQKMFQSSKQVIAIVLCLVLALTTLPISASAAPVAQTDWTKVKAEEVTATLSPDISITLDGKKLDLLNVSGAEVAPLNYKGSVFVPVRAISYAFNYMIGWWAWGQPQPDKTMHDVRIWTNWDKNAWGQVVVPPKTSTINNKTPRAVKATSDFTIVTTLDHTLVGLWDANGNRVAPIIYDGTTYLPIRGIAQVFGCSVTWDGGSRTVSLTRGGQPLFGDNPYIPLRAPTEAESKAFLDGAPNNTARNQRFIDWLYANTDALVSYISTYYDDSNSTTYGFNGNANCTYYETPTVKAYFSKMTGNSDRETAVNVISSVDQMVVYGIGKHRREIDTLSGTQPYVLDCYGSSELVIAALKAAGIPAFRVDGINLASNIGHAWVACYLPDEDAWEFVEATIDLTRIASPFLKRQALDEVYKIEEIAVPGGMLFFLDVARPLAASYYLHYVYPDHVAPVS